MQYFALFYMTSSLYDHDSWKIKDYREYSSIEEAKGRFESLKSWSVGRISGISMTVLAFDPANQTSTVVEEMKCLHPLKKRIEMNVEAKKAKQSVKIQALMDEIGAIQPLTAWTSTPPTPFCNTSTTNQI